MIKAYKDYWKGYADFAGRTSVGGYWFAVLAHLLVTFVLSFVVGILGQLGSMQTVKTYLYLTAFEFLCILPSLAIVVRRLRDAGCSWTNLFWMFLPIAGPIILIVKLCKPSATSAPSTLSTSWTTGTELGPWRIPAAILLLWGTLTVLASIISAGALNALLSMNVFWWLLRLSMIALVVLIFIGKKNAGLLIPSGLVFLLSLRGLILTPAIGNFLSTAGWAAACLVMALAIFRQKSPPAVLLYLPSGLFLALGIYLIAAAVRNSGFTISVFTNVFWAMAFFFMAKALADKPRAQPTSHIAAGGASFSTSPQPQPRQPYAPTGYTAPNRKNPGVLLVRFSIEKLNNLSGSYGFQSGKLIGQAVPAALLEGMTISDGDSAATLAGREYVCVVSIASNDISILTQKIEPLLQASKEIRENGAPPITQVVGSTREPLVVDGVVRNGRIEGSGGWCANGLMSAWKEAAERPAEATQAGAATQPAASPVTLPEGATPCEWTDAAEMLTAIQNTWGVTVKPFRISESDARALEQQCPMDKDLIAEQAQYAVEQSANSVFWHEYGSWIDFKYTKFLYKERLYYVNVSPTVNLTPSMYDRKGDLNNMAKILVCLAKQAGADRDRLVFVLEGTLTDHE